MVTVMVMVKLTGRALIHPWGRCRSRPGPSPPSPASNRSPASNNKFIPSDMSREKVVTVEIVIYRERNCWAPPLSSRRTPWHAQGWTWLATEKMELGGGGVGWSKLFRLFAAIPMISWCPVFCVLVSYTASKFKTKLLLQHLHWNISRSGRTGPIRKGASDNGCFLEQHDIGRCKRGCKVKHVINTWTAE